MKKLATLLCIFGSIYLISAQQIKILVIDVGEPDKESCGVYFESDSEECGNLAIRSNQRLWVKIVNANPYKYQYSIQNTPLDFFADRLSEFDSLLSSIDESRQNGTTIKVKDGADITPPDSLETQLKKKLKSMGSVEDSIVLKGIDRNALEITNPVKEKISKQIDTLKRKIKIQDSLIHLKDSRLNKQAATIRIQNTTISKLKKELDSLRKELENKKKYLDAHNTIYEQVSTLQNLKKDMDLFLIDLKNEDYLNQLDEFDSVRKAYKKRIHNVIETVQSTIEKYEENLSKEDQKKFNKYLENTYKPLLKNIQDELNLLLALKKKHYVLPLEFDGENIDAIHIQVTRKKRDADTPAEEFDYEIWVKGGFKLDVSGGIFFSGLVNQKFVFLPEPVTPNENGDGTSDDTSDGENQGQLLGKANTGKLGYGFGSMLHLSYRTGGWIKPTVGIGAMLTADSGYQFLLGTGGIFGKKSRLVATVGLSLGQIAQLQNGFKIDGQTRYDIPSESAIPTEKKFTSSIFFGFTYNLSKVKTNDNQN